MAVDQPGIGQTRLAFCASEPMWKWDKTQKIYWAKKTANLPKIQPTGKKEYEQASTAGRDKWTGNMEDILQKLQVEELLFYPLMRLIL